MAGLISIKAWALSQKMAGNKRKGDNFQKEIAAFLEARGWVVDVVEPAKRMIIRGGRRGWITVKEDFFGAFDLIALRKEKSPVLLIQATTNRGMIRAKMRKIAEAVGAWAEGRELVVITSPLHKDEAAFDDHPANRLEFYFLQPDGEWKTVGVEYFAISQ